MMKLLYSSKHGSSVNPTDFWLVEINNKQRQVAMETIQTRTNLMLFMVKVQSLLILNNL